MRRRRRSNKVLGRAMLIAFGIVLLLLPILGYMGAFKAIKQDYTEVTMVELPPPPPEPKSAQAKKAHPHAEHHGEVHVAGSKVPLAVHVAAVAPSPGTSADDNTIVNGSNTNIGAVPPAVSTPAIAPPPAAPPVTTASPAPTVPPPPPPAPAPPAIADQDATVIPDTQIKPTIPDDLRDSDLDASFRALFTVHSDGTADVQVVDSTGNNELDQLALQAARQWKFKPAVKDGEPVQSYLRLWVEFEVS